MKKKLLAGLSIVLVAFGLAGCGKDAQTQFLDELGKYSGKDQQALSYEMKIKDLEFNDDMNDSPQANVIVTQLKDMSINGNMIVDSKKDSTYKMNMSINFMGQKLPMEIVGNKSKTYLSAEFFSGMVGIMQSFSQSSEALPELGDLKGKYIDVEEMSEATSSDTKVDSKNLTDYYQAVAEENKAYLKKLDKKSFTEKDAVVSHTFTKQEFTDMLKNANKVAESDKKYKEFKLEKDPKEILDNFDKLDAQVKINTKTKTQDWTFTIAPKKSDSSPFKSASLTMKVMDEEFTETPKIPDKKQILSKEELQKIMASLSPAISGTSPQPGEAADQNIVSDEAMQALVESLNQAKDQLTDEEKTQIKEQYKEYLTEEQYKQLEAALQ